MKVRKEDSVMILNRHRNSSNRLRWFCSDRFIADRSSFIFSSRSLKR